MGANLHKNNIRFSKRYSFSEWPNRNVPQVVAGVYAIWNDDDLFYCGMSGRDIEGATASNRKRYGLITRLNSHASGRLSGDQFCVYVANRLVIPALSAVQLSQFKSGELTLDKLTKEYIHQHLSYQYVLVGSSREAYEVENLARKGELLGVKPFLNPLGD
jgi:hypothetical protein